LDRRVRLTAFETEFIYLFLFSYSNQEAKSKSTNLWTTMSSAGTIQSVFGREIIDCRGNPTIEVEIRTQNGLFRASVPSGATLSDNEVVELRDGDASRFHGLGVLNAVKIINETISKRLEGVNTEDQHSIDRILHELDGSHNFSNIGGNTALGVSMAAARAGAASKGIPLFEHIANIAGKVVLQVPLPVFNLIHGGGDSSSSDTSHQEFMIVPIGTASYQEALRCGCEIYQELRNLLFSRFGRAGVNVGEDGAFSPSLASPDECCDLIRTAIESAGYSLETVKIAINILASETTRQEKAAAMTVDVTEQEQGDRRKQIETFWNNLQKRDYGKAIICLEDPFEGNDWTNFLSEETTKATSAESRLTAMLIVGDDLPASNVDRFPEAAQRQACNALLLKPNQCGTVMDSINAAVTAEKYRWTVMTARRTGETEDDFTADFSVGISAKYIKAGAPCRSERLAKYNQILIEQHLQNNTCACCGSLSCKCVPGRCSCQPKSGNIEFNYTTRYKTHCG